jgi:hypothetical protein
MTISAEWVVRRRKGRRVRYQNTRTLAWSEWTQEPDPTGTVTAMRTFSNEMIRVGDLMYEVRANLETFARQYQEWKDGLQKMTKADLHLECDERGLSYTTKATRTQLIERIVAFDEEFGDATTVAPLAKAPQEKEA